MANITVSVIVNEEEQQAIEERREYLRQKTGLTRISKADAIRHAIMQTNYKRQGKKNSDDEDIEE